MELTVSFYMFSFEYSLSFAQDSMKSTQVERENLFAYEIVQTSICQFFGFAQKPREC